MASRLLLFGISLVFASTGSLELSTVVPALTQQSGAMPLLATMFIVCGMAFKLALAPLHIWSPDVYEGSPWPVVSWLSTVSKIAIFVVFVRVFAAQSGTGSVMSLWAGLLLSLTLLSAFVGNIMALLQTNFKRLLAYSTVSHMGFIIISVITQPGPDIQLLHGLFYLSVYGLSVVGLVVTVQGLNIGGKAQGKLKILVV